MVRNISLLALLGLGAVLLSPTTSAQANWGEVAGRITEAGTGAPIISATVLVEGTNFGTAADEEGRLCDTIIAQPANQIGKRGA